MATAPTPLRTVAGNLCLGSAPDSWGIWFPEDEQQVPYTEINIDEDEDAARRVEQWNHGNRTIPTLDIAGTILTNPSPAQLRQVLGL